MAYIGNPPAERYSSVSYQDLTGGTGTSFTLDYSVGSANEIEVFVNNVRQEPSVAYTVSGTALTMTGSIASTDDFYVVFQGKAQQTVTHPATHALEATDGTFTGDLTVDTNTLHVDSTNNRVGIGTTSPNRDLEISSSAPHVRLTDTDGGYAELYGGQGYLDIHADRGNAVASSRMTFNVDGSEKMRILSSGGITFNGDTAAANALDDYEEGTFNAVLSGNASTSGQTYNSQVCKYIKIGTLVHVQGYVSCSNIGTVSGSYGIISGLPFTVGGTYGDYAGGVFGYFTGMGVNSAGFTIYPEINQTFAYVTYRSSFGSVSQYIAPSGWGSAPTIMFSLAYRTT